MLRFSYLFLLSLLAFTFTACGGDDDVTPNEETSLIVGTWRATSGTQVGTSSTTFGGMDIDIDFTTRLITPTDYGVVFTANPNKVVGAGTANLETSYNFNGSPATIETPVELPLQSGDWEIRGDKLHLTSPGQDPYEVDIVTLNDSILMLRGTYSTTMTQAGVTATSVSDFNYSYERQ